MIAPPSVTPAPRKDSRATGSSCATDRGAAVSPCLSDPVRADVEVYRRPQAFDRRGAGVEPEGKFELLVPDLPTRGRSSSSARRRAPARAVPSRDCSAPASTSSASRATRTGTRPRNRAARGRSPMSTADGFVAGTTRSSTTDRRRALQHRDPRRRLSRCRWASTTPTCRSFVDTLRGRRRSATSGAASTSTGSTSSRPTAAPTIRSPAATAARGPARRRRPTSTRRSAAAAASAAC